MITAKVSEIFKSFQGEGVYQGVLQVFVRFFGCNMACSYCDTPQKRFKEFTPENLIKQIGKFGKFYHSIALTGGEPLLSVDFLKDFLPLIKKGKGRTYLDTNGTLPKELSQILKYIDIIAMDIKLPSSTGYKPLWDEHREFLEVALKKEVFIKVVICNSTTKEDLIESLSLVKKFNHNIPFILQPEYNSMVKNGLAEKMEEFMKISQRHLNFVRVIAQMHKILGVK